MEHDERRGTQGQHKPFQIALSLNNAAVWRRAGGRGSKGGKGRGGEEKKKRKNLRTVCNRDFKM